MIAAGCAPAATGDRRARCAGPGRRRKRCAVGRDARGPRRWVRLPPAARRLLLLGDMPAFLERATRRPARPARLARAALAAVAAVGCRHAPEPTALDPGDRLVEPHAAPAAAPAERIELDRPRVVRFHMQRHFDDLRAIERQLIAGRLDEARALAHLLARPAGDPGIAPWAPEARQVADAALALAAAPSLDDACRRAARVSAACAACHLRTRAAPVFPPPPSLPPDRPTRDARMARHLWATDRLWEAMVGGSEPAWHGGLAVLADAPLPFAATDTSRLARRLQDLARDQLSPATAAADHAAAYGELLVTCAGCHARSRSAAR